MGQARACSHGRCGLQAHVARLQPYVSSLPPPMHPAAVHVAGGAVLDLDRLGARHGTLHRAVVRADEPRPLLLLAGMSVVASNYARTHFVH